MLRYLRLLRTALALGLCAFIQLALAQDYPARPIRLLIPYAPGGTPDTINRALSTFMSPILGQQLLVDNRPGADGIPAVQELLRSAPDGYTLIAADPGQWAILPALHRITFNPEKDLVAVGQVFTQSLYIVVRSALGVKTLSEFINLAKSKPGALSYGSSGSGSVHNLFMESFKSANRIDIVHIPYKGAGQMVPALLGGDIPVGIAGLIAIQSHIKSGQLLLLAATTRERSRLTPDVIAMGDIGLPDLNFAGDSGLFAPPGTLRVIVDTLTRALSRAVKQDEFIKRADLLGAEAMYRNPQELAEVVRNDGPRYEKAVKLAALANK